MPPNCKLWSTGAGAGFWATVLNRDIKGCFLGSQSVVWPFAAGGKIDTELSLFPFADFRGVWGALLGRLDGLKGEACFACVFGGLKIFPFPFEGCSARRGAEFLPIEGIGALVIEAADCS